jgi:hypothetical protein
MHRLKNRIRPPTSGKSSSLGLAIFAWLATSAAAFGVDVQGVQPIAFDQPRVFGALLPAGGTTPYTGLDIFGDPSFTIQAFLDTGSSGIIIDPRTASALGVPVTLGVSYTDVAIGGGTTFAVSPPLDVRVANSTETDLDRTSTLTTVYKQAFPSLRAQVGPTNISPDPLSDPLDIFGMPAMMGKTVVMDPKPLNTGDIFSLDLMHTYIYNPGTPFNPLTADTNPGIPSTSHHVSLSYANFDQFTSTTPAGATPPTTNHNPFIGPNPLNQLQQSPPTDNTPSVSVDFGGLQTSGSFLLDTGAVTSFLSTKLAASLHVRYVDGTFGTDNPQLESFDPAHPGDPGTLLDHQFIFPIQGIGGTALLAGFFLDHMILHTQEGGPSDADPNNIRFVGAPVLVVDVELPDPGGGLPLTLDGIFGMNFTVASAFVTPDLNIGETAIGAFNWITFDEPSGVLGLDMGIGVPEPGSMALATSGLVALVGYALFHRRSPRRVRG